MNPITATMILPHALVKKVNDTDFHDLGTAFKETAEEVYKNRFRVKLASFVFPDGVRADLYVMQGREDFYFFVLWYDKDGNAIGVKQADMSKTHEADVIRTHLETKYASHLWDGDSFVTKYGYELKDENGEITHVLDVKDEMLAELAALEKLKSSLEWELDLQAKRNARIEQLKEQINAAKSNLTAKGIDYSAVFPA